MPNKAVCSIEYVERINKLVNIKFIVEEFILSDSVRERGVALAIIQNTLAHEQLKKKNLPGYVRIRTCALESYEPCSDTVEDPELVALTDKAVAMDCVPQTIGNYDGDLLKHKLRKAIDDKHDSIERDKKRRGRPRAGEAYELAG